MADTPNAKRLKEEAELDKLSKFGIGFKYGKRGPIDRLLRDEGYGTSRSPGAQHAGHEKAEGIFRKEDKTVGETMADPRPRQAMREAAAEERRESRGMKKGGMTASKRADGIAIRGKTRA
jgi:hypothetical protein